MTTTQAQPIAAQPTERAASAVQHRKLAKRGLRVCVVARPLSDGSQVYSVQLVDRDENSALMLAELDCINESRACALRDDICDSLRRNSVVNILPNV